MAPEWLQPAFYDSFRCVGSECEDVCCQGWGISVDKATYSKYQSVSDEPLGPKLRKLVLIQKADSEAAYAKIQMVDGCCPFLDDGLCSIQSRLGEEYLGRTCASYPRVINYAGGQAERTLDLSCPEAARLTMQDARPLEFGAELGGIRQLVMSLLQNRNYSIGQRLALVGVVCDRRSSGVEGEFDADGYDLTFVVDPGRQLAITLDLLVARMQLDYTAPQYLELYREFVNGLGLRSGTQAESFGAGYAAAYRDYYAPFMEQHEYMLEQYLVSYAFKTMFPFGLTPVNKALDLAQPDATFVAQFMLMAAYFAMSKTVMIGLAARYKEQFSAAHVVRAVQSISKMMEHCESYPRKALEVLAGRGIRSAGEMAVLTMN